MSDLIVTLIQTQLFWEDKEANLRMFENKIQAIQGSKQVVILPEMFSTGFSMEPEKLAETMDGSSVNWMRRISQENKIILCGSIIMEENGQYYNRMIWIQPNGEYAFYDKSHLFGYAGENKKYAAGNRRVVVSVNGWRILLQVCYDLRFPVWARQQPTGQNNFEFDAIVYVANWPERRNLAWKTLLPARAIENQCFVIGVNRVGDDGNGIYHSGDSQIIDPLGNRLYEKRDREDTFTAQLSWEQLQKIRSRFPFAKDADDFRILNQ